MPFDSTQLVARKQQDFLRRLGAFDWLKIIKEKGGFNVQVSLENVDPDLHLTLANYMVKGDTITDRLALNIYSKLFAQGLRVFECTWEQCLAMEQVDLTLPIVDYKQAYPLMVYSFPKDYRDYLRDTFKHDAPLYAIIYESLEYKQLCIRYQGYEIIGMYPQTDSRSFQEAIANRFNLDENGKEENDPLLSTDFPITEACERVALNLGLFLTNYGFKSSWCPERKKHLKLKNKYPNKPLGQLYLGDYEIISLDQNIKLYHSENAKGQKVSSKLSLTKRPHWRRGHWRQYREGEFFKRSFQKFIRPVAIHKEAMVKTTEVHYKG